MCPFYDYSCDHCKIIEEVMKSVTESESPESCPVCKRQMVKQLAAVAVHGGFYDKRLSLPARNKPGTREGTEDGN
jgi:putative FmdB family regulatory protein